MAPLRLNWKAATSLISAVTDGKNIVADYFSCQWQLEIEVRQGQVVLLAIDLNRPAHRR